MSERQLWLAVLQNAGNVISVYLHIRNVIATALPCLIARWAWQDWAWINLPRSLTFPVLDLYKRAHTVLRKGQARLVTWLQGGAPARLCFLVIGTAVCQNPDWGERQLVPRPVLLGIAGRALRERSFLFVSCLSTLPKGFCLRGFLCLLGGAYENAQGWESHPKPWPATSGRLGLTQRALQDELLAKHGLPLKLAGEKIVCLLLIENHRSSLLPKSSGLFSVYSSAACRSQPIGSFCPCSKTYWIVWILIFVSQNLTCVSPRLW